MKQNLCYHDTGEKFFHDGNSIFINYIDEPTMPHLHLHDFIEISYVASGTGIHILGDKEYEVRKGDLFLINYHIPHEFRSMESPKAPPLKVYNCVFKPDFIDINLLDYKEFTDIIHYLSYRSVFSLDWADMEEVKLLGGENTDLEATYKKMLVEYTKKEDGYIELLRVYLIELFILIFRKLKNTSKSENSNIAHHSKLIEQSIVYLKNNYAGSTKLNDIASHAFLSPTYFCRIFKEYTGTTVSEYIQRLRIDEACNLLTNTDNKIILIAQMVGYKDLKHFNEIFKKITGMTPSGYKRLNEKI
ncbi:MAG: transcriptional regulator, AraC family [Anaerocolumna sp.]|jgi:AraC family L-rhamnose operon transcriptional activator RhaR|nr:transcriptional regulator, AraC family [Anaerocolumna sp.]